MNTIVSPLIVREAKAFDLSGLRELLSTVRRRDDIIDEFEAAILFAETGCADLELNDMEPYRCPLKAFVAFNNGILVGVAIIT